MRILIFTIIGVLQTFALAASTYYVDSAAGNDRNDGRSPQKAWRSLDKAGSIGYAAGDRLLLKRGSVLKGALALKASGAEGSPVVVDAYGKGEMPVIDSAGYPAGIAIEGCRYLEVNNVAVTADGSDVPGKAGRYGVLITSGDAASQHVYLRGLYIHDIFAAKTNENGLGDGIHVQASGQGTLRDLLIENCRIERTAAIGIAIRGRKDPEYAINGIRILNNRFKDIGGPGMNPSTVKGLVVRGNVVDGSGSSVDKRMRARGSGIWPWGSEDVLIERNTFMHARGKADSCGMHIDFNCRNVVVQYNLSIDNAGGFVEILGNDYNCAYRYNISINDGFRIKGKDGASQDGKTIWLSSYTGDKGVKQGPFNSYIYNNTVYVKQDIRSAFSITRATSGALIANNIFYILGDTENVGDDQDRRTLPPTAAVKNVVIKNNLYLRVNTLPGNLPMEDGRPLHDLSEVIADPQFKNPGGLKPADYIPGNTQVIKDKGIRITALPGDSLGLTRGLEVKKDFFGNPIVGAPDLGAIEIK